MELSIKKVGKSQYGSYVQFEDGTYKGCTEQVQKFLDSKTPCSIEIEATTGEGNAEKISKVKVLSSQAKPSLKSAKQEAIDEAIERKTVSVMQSYAKDLYVANLEAYSRVCKDKKELDKMRDSLKEELYNDVKGFLAQHDELLKQDKPESEQ